MFFVSGLYPYKNMSLTLLIHENNTLEMSFFLSYVKKKFLSKNTAAKSTNIFKKTTNFTGEH